MSNQYNETPTFKLNTYEKADMSPYLFHVTDYKSLLSILFENENSMKGVIKASQPFYIDKGSLDMRRVSFTETPVHALGFFKYRKRTNKEDDKTGYGNILDSAIGFDKKSMVDKGVFPVNYVQSIFETSKRELHEECNKVIPYYRDLLFYLKENCPDSKDLENFLNNNSEIKKLNNKYKYNFSFKDTSHHVWRLELFLNQFLSFVDKSFKHLNFGNYSYQGFSWEREWIYSEENNKDTSDSISYEDFEFNYEDIKVICCPHQNFSKIKNEFNNIGFSPPENICYRDFILEYDVFKECFKKMEDLYKNY